MWPVPYAQAIRGSSRCRHAPNPWDSVYDDLVLPSVWSGAGYDAGERATRPPGPHPIGSRAVALFKPRSPSIRSATIQTGITVIHSASRPRLYHVKLFRRISPSSMSRSVLISPTGRQAREDGPSLSYRFRRSRIRSFIRSVSSKCSTYRGMTAG